MEKNVLCKEHPDAPHSFMRDASHSAGRYVCECESWEPPKREWVGLNHFDRTLLRTTHAPSKQIYHDKDNSVCVEVVSDWDVFFDAIEAKLKEKNHG